MHYLYVGGILAYDTSLWMTTHLYLLLVKTSDTINQTRPAYIYNRSIAVILNTGYVSCVCLTV